MYKILFIDEEQDTLNDFADYVDGSTTKVPLELITELPSKDKNEMINKIFEINPDAIITDFRLNEMKEDIQYNVSYNGVDLVEEFQNIRLGFPCFVLTALDDEAVSQSKDVNIIYVKNLISNEQDGPARAKFLDRVVSQIQHYKFMISSAEDELMKLIELRRSGKANISDEERIIDLDHLLETSINRKSSIPVEFKSLSNTAHLSKLFDKVDELITRVGESSGD